MEQRGDLSPLRLIYYTIFFGNVKKKTAQKSKKIVKKVDNLRYLEYNSERRKQAVGESGLQSGSCRRQRRRTHMKKQKVSDAVIHRLPRYYRYLDELHNKGVVRISSNSLGQKMDITASQIRQDLSCFGEFGQQGYGYNVNTLLAEIKNILAITHPYNAIIVGAGNIGTALANFDGFEQEGFIINALFDVKEELLGTEIDGKPVYHIDEMERYVQENNITIGVIAARRSVAQGIADRMVASGIKGIWNFAPMDVTATVPVENIHMTDSLICLMYKMHHNVISEN